MESRKFLNKVQHLEKRLVLALQQVPAVKSAVLFGSFLKNPDLARDVDVLLILAYDADPEEALTAVERKLIDFFPELSVETFDLVPFLPGQVDPFVILEAVRTGRVLFNHEEAYEDALERLSRYFTLNEVVLKPQEADLYGTTAL